MSSIQGGRALKREGAIADIKVLTNPNQPLKCSQQKDDNTNESHLTDNYGYIFPSTLMFSLLTLDHSTLFYWTLSNDSCKKRKHSSAINDWASAIPTSAKPSSQAQKSTSSRAKSGLPSLTSGASRSSAPSVLTQNVKIITGHIKAEPAPDVHTMYYDSGLSDNDEMRGEE